LAEKKIPYQLVEVDLKNKPKDLLELNPYAKVPVLVDGDGVIYESAIVNEFLEEKYPTLRLLPDDYVKRAKVRVWVDFFNTRIHPTASDLQHKRDFEKATQRMKGHLATLDREMTGKEFIVDEYSLADVTFIPFYTRRERYGVIIDDNYPNVKRWGETLIARPAVAATL
jgi:glutathione S-transferase